MEYIYRRSGYINIYAVGSSTSQMWASSLFCREQRSLALQAVAQCLLGHDARHRSGGCRVLFPAVGGGVSDGSGVAKGDARWHRCALCIDELRNRGHAALTRTLHLVDWLAGHHRVHAI